MSSREIAELCEKRHSHVLRDIEKMVQDIAEPNFGLSDFEGAYTDPTGRSLKEYRLPKDLTITLITGYRADLRYRVVKKLEEMEAAQSAAIDYSSPVVMLGVIENLKLESDKAKAKVIELTPKAAGFDHLLSAEGLYGLQNAARALGARPNLFTSWLKQTFLFYQGGSLVPRVRYTQQGLFEVKTTIIDDKARPRTYITPKGLDYFREKIPANLLIGGAA